MLILKDINVELQNIEILSDVSLEFKPSYISTIIGPNGAGKTTLFNAVSGLVPIKKGKIILNNKEIQNLKHYQRANLGIGRLFQDVKIFEQMTVFENILTACFTRKEENPLYPFIFSTKLIISLRKYREKVEELAELVGLKDFLKVNASDLSFGQQKLLALARLLAMNSSVLLLDEPTAGLNPIMREKVEEIILSLKEKGKTIVIIEHDLEFVKNITDWMYFMYEGKIYYSGKVEHVLTNEEVRDRYMGMKNV